MPLASVFLGLEGGDGLEWRVVLGAGEEDERGEAEEDERFHGCLFRRWWAKVWLFKEAFPPAILADGFAGVSPVDEGVIDVMMAELGFGEFVIFDCFEEFGKFVEEFGVPVGGVEGPHAGGGAGKFEAAHLGCVHGVAHPVFGEVPGGVPFDGGFDAGAEAGFLGGEVADFLAEAFLIDEEEAGAHEVEAAAVFSAGVFLVGEGGEVALWGGLAGVGAEEEDIGVFLIELDGFLEPGLAAAAEEDVGIAVEDVAAFCLGDAVEVGVAGAAAEVLFADGLAAGPLVGALLFGCGGVVDFGDADLVAEWRDDFEEGFFAFFPVGTEAALAAVEVDGEENFIDLIFPGGDLVWKEMLGEAVVAGGEVDLESGLHLIWRGRLSGRIRQGGRIFPKPSGVRRRGGRLFWRR